jgi:glucose-1-phosphate cytidylyltransferase
MSEETHLYPKPMVEIGDKPILWHIMKSYSYHGIHDFIVCLGYKGYSIKEYFSNYFLHTSDVTFNICDNSFEVHKRNAEPWRVTLVDTGEATMTGGRLKRVGHFLSSDDAFCVTYGDGLADIDFRSQLAFHKQHGRLATVTAVRPPGRFGALTLSGDGFTVERFTEKPVGEEGWINGGFFLLSPKVLDYISDDHTSWELEPLHRLSVERQLMAFRHEGFWHPMDTMRDKRVLDNLWASGRAPWKVWP